MITPETGVCSLSFLLYLPCVKLNCRSYTHAKSHTNFSSKEKQTTITCTFMIQEGGGRTKTKQWSVKFAMKHTCGCQFNWSWITYCFSCVSIWLCMYTFLVAFVFWNWILGTFIWVASCNLTRPMHAVSLLSCNVNDPVWCL